MPPLKVLVIDDDWKTTKLIRMNLEGYGFEVTEAGTGEDCLRMLKAGGVHLVLLDLNLPDLSGWDVLAVLKSTEALRDVPVIIISVEPPNRALATRFGPEDYIEKPFDVRELVARIGKIVRDRYGRDGFQGKSLNCREGGAA